MTHSNAADYSLSIPATDAEDRQSFDEEGWLEAEHDGKVHTVGKARAEPVSDGGLGAAGTPAPLAARVPAALAGMRLDKVLARLFPSYSRARLQDWLEAGRVQIDGRLARHRQPAVRDAEIVVRPALLPEQHAFVAEPVELTVLHEDAALLVLDKPAGRVVHPAAGNWGNTLLNGLLYRYGEAAARLPRAGIVHRLDKDTSGLMVVARTLEAQTDLVRQLQARTVKRSYLALVWGTPPERGTVDAPLGRDPRDRLRMAVVEGAAGKPARTHFRALARGDWEGQSVAALQCELETGRTHQIRVHLAHLGHPLLGDPLYARARRRATLPQGFARQALHAWRLALLHPFGLGPVHWLAPPSADLALLAQALGLEAALAQAPT